MKISFTSLLVVLISMAVMFPMIVDAKPPQRKPKTIVVDGSTSGQMQPKPNHF